MIRILRLLVPASILAMFLCEAVLICGSYLAAVYLNRNLDPQVFLIDRSGWQAILAAAASMLLGMHLRQLYSQLRIQSRILLLQELSLVMGAVFIAEALLTYFQSTWALPRSVLLLGSGFALASVYIWRTLFSAPLRRRLGMQRVLFIGLPPAAGKLIRFLDQHPEAGFAPVGYLDRDPAGAGTKLERLGSPRNLDDAIERHHPDWIVIDGRSGIAAPQVDDLVELRFGGVRIEDVESFYERTTGRVHSGSIRPSESVFAESLLPDAVNQKLQSIYATIAVLLALPAAIPVMGAVALALRLTSRRPVILREQRAGFCGAPFTMYRFRLAPDGAGISGFLRKSGLDRLPQVWNVLRGEMTLVGPEADRLEFAGRLNQTIPLYSQRLLVHPGLIGWAQIHEHSDGSVRDAIRRLEYDLYYMKNLSPLLDLFVVLRWFRATLPFSDAAAA